MLWEMPEEPDTFRREKMRFQGVKYYLPPHEGSGRGLQLLGGGSEGRTLAKEKKLQHCIEQNILTIELSIGKDAEKLGTSVLKKKQKLFNNELGCFVR